MKLKHRRTHRRQKGRSGRQHWIKDDRFGEPSKFPEVGPFENSGSTSLVPFVHEGEITRDLPGFRAVPSIGGAGWFFIPGTGTMLGVRLVRTWTARIQRGPDYLFAEHHSIEFDEAGEVEREEGFQIIAFKI